LDFNSNSIEIMEIKFMALMKKLEIKSLVSLDRGGRLLLEFNADEETIAGLNRIMSAEDEVEVKIEK